MAGPYAFGQIAPHECVGTHHCGMMPNKWPLATGSRQPVSEHCMQTASACTAIAALLLTTQPANPQTGLRKSVTTEGSIDATVDTLHAIQLMGRQHQLVDRLRPPFMHPRRLCTHIYPAQQST
jgi:hypothetical protein